MKIKNYIKNNLSKINIDNYERLLSYSVLRNQFHSLSNVKIYTKRESLWDGVITAVLNPNDPVVFIEFGVHEGYSLNYFANKNDNEESIFFGLDSFEGLPEDWGLCKKGAFNKNGMIPFFKDSRVSCIKGWFQDSWIVLEEKLSDIKLDSIIVHYDADLYSSTLFALCKMDQFKKPYLAIFDEFMGHETRALYNYTQAFNAKVEFLGQTLGNTRESIIGYPQQVVARITPNI